MTATIWLASYPKSGNTWFRAILASLATGAPPDINALAGTGGIASSREMFDQKTLIDSGLLTHDEADLIRPRVYEAVAQGSLESGKCVFIKVHDLYGRTPAGEPLLAGASAARGAIVMVRDPRDVASSFAHHSGWSLDDAIRAMGRSQHAYCGDEHAQAPQLRQRLGSWSEHVESWLDQADISVHLLRYEDLAARPVQSLMAALDFAGEPVSTATAERAVAMADFVSLQEQERTTGFAERPLESSAPFFRRGKVGEWRHELNAAQVRQLEQDHGRVMARLNYTVSTKSQIAAGQDQSKGIHNGRT